MIEAVKTCFAKYFTFSGRARRAEYWWFLLFVILLGIVASSIDGLIFGPAVETVTVTAEDGTTSTVERAEYGGGPIATVAGLATFIPLLAVGWRRMHDTGRSGWLYILPTLVVLGSILLTLLVGGIFVASGGGEPPESGGALAIIPLLGFLAGGIAFVLLLWWLTRPSDPGPNAYGPEPVR
jgi:uncharacterized membrane protein YhaH (DUF805 family)